MPEHRPPVRAFRSLLSASSRAVSDFRRDLGYGLRVIGRPGYALTAIVLLVGSASVPSSSASSTGVLSAEHKMVA
jgi:hypothetical protein